MQFKDKIALVTGGGSGLGAATAETLAKKGAKCVLVDRQIEAASQLAEKISGAAYQCDVTDETGVEATFEKIKNEIGTPRILVNCAGVAPAAKVVGRDGAMPLAQFTKTIQINLIGTFNFIRLCAEAITSDDSAANMIEKGVIINTASVAAYEGQLGQAAYSASKAGVVGMTVPIAREFARYGIRIVTIAPGIMDTPMMANMPDKVRDSLAEMVPFPKRLGAAQEFANLVSHIVENEYLNGCTLRLDGAIRMQ